MRVFRVGIVMALAACGDGTGPNVAERLVGSWVDAADTVVSSNAATTIKRATLRITRERGELTGSMSWSSHLITNDGGLWPQKVRRWDVQDVRTVRDSVYWTLFLSVSSSFPVERTHTEVVPFDGQVCCRGEVLTGVIVWPRSSGPWAGRIDTLHFERR